MEATPINPNGFWNLAAILFVMVVSCNGNRTENNSTDTKRQLTVFELAKQLEKNDGKLVEVTGRFSYFFEDVAVYDDNFFADDKNAFWVNPIDDFAKDEDVLRSLSGKIVLVKGKLNTKRKGHLGRYTAKLDSVYFIGLK